MPQDQLILIIYKWLHYVFLNKRLHDVNLCSKLRLQGLRGVLWYTPSPKLKHVKCSDCFIPNHNLITNGYIKISVFDVFKFERSENVSKNIIGLWQAYFVSPQQSPQTTRIHKHDCPSVSLVVFFHRCNIVVVWVIFLPHDRVWGSWQEKWSPGKFGRSIHKVGGDSLSFLYMDVVFSHSFFICFPHISVYMHAPLCIV
jgi:hypothetical protein